MQALPSLDPTKPRTERVRFLISLDDLQVKDPPPGVDPNKTTYHVAGFAVPAEWFWTYLGLEGIPERRDLMRLVREAWKKIQADTMISTLQVFQDSWEEDKFISVYPYDPEWPYRFAMGKELFELDIAHEAKIERLREILGKSPNAPLEDRVISLEW